MNEQRREVFRSGPGAIVNSLLAAFAGLVLAEMFEGLGLALSGMAFGRDVAYYGFHAEFRADGNDLALLGGVAASLLAGFGFLILFPRAQERGAGKLTILWTSLFSFRLATAGMMQYYFAPEDGIGEALAAYELPTWLPMAVGITGAVLMLLFAAAAATSFLGFCRHISEVNAPGRRLQFMATFALVPGIGAALVFMAVFAGMDGFAASWALPVFLIVTLLVAPMTKNLRLPYQLEAFDLSIGLIVGVIVLVALVRFGFGPGLVLPPFDSDFNLHFRP